ncbi:hypothetical protein F6455_05375 [Proteobacteria bacterium 005FR1]|nr:hypothetical protein [Proteobacteria bacterium 005FR1]
MIKSSISLLIANIVYACSQWGLVVYLTRRGDLELLGAYSFYLGVFTPLAVLMSLNLRQVLTATKNISQEGPELLQCFFMSAAFFAVSVPIIQVASDDHWTSLLYILGAFKFFDAIFEVASGFYQREGKFGSIAFSKLLRGAAMLALLATPFPSSDTLVYSFLFVGICVILVVDVRGYLLKKAFEWRHTFSSGTIRRLVSLLPFTVSALVDSLYLALPRFQLVKMGFEAVGIYSALVYVLVAGGVILASISGLVLAKLSGAVFARNRDGFLRWLSGSQIVSAALSLLIIVSVHLFGAFVIEHSYGDLLSEYTKELTLITLAMGGWFISGFNACALVAMQRYSDVVSVNIFGFLVLCICLALGPLGVESAIWSLLAAYMARAICSTVLLITRIYEFGWSHAEIREAS